MLFSRPETPSHCLKTFTSQGRADTLTLDSGRSYKHSAALPEKCPSRTVVHYRGQTHKIRGTEPATTNRDRGSPILQ